MATRDRLVWHDSIYCSCARYHFIRKKSQLYTIMRSGDNITDTPVQNICKMIYSVSFKGRSFFYHYLTGSNFFVQCSPVVTHVRRQTFTFVSVLALGHIYTQARTYANTYTRTHTLARTRAHAHRHTNKQTNTYI